MKKYEQNKTWNHKIKREQILDELQFKCQKCKSVIKEIGQLQIHHKDSNPQNENPDNLEALCMKCHGEVHGRKYQKFSIVKRKIGRPVKVTFRNSYKKEDTGKRKGLFL